MALLDARQTVAVLVALKYLRNNPPKSERPLLNERAVQHIGQCYDLVDPIVNGRGSAKIGDSIWRVEGPELPKGARVGTSSLRSQDAPNHQHPFSVQRSSFSVSSIWSSR